VRRGTVFRLDFAIYELYKFELGDEYGKGIESSFIRGRKSSGLFWDITLRFMGSP